MKGTRKRRSLRAFLIVLVIFTLGNSSDAFLILRAQTLGLTVIGVLGLMMVFNLVYALLSTPAGVLSDQIGRRKVVLAGWGLYALVYLGFARADQTWQAWILMAIYGMYYGLTEGAARAYIADLVPAPSRGSAYGVMHMAVGISLLPASLIAGVLWQGIGGWEGWGPAAPFYFGALMALIAALGLAFSPGPEQGAA
jgi:MFS family permease